jgi:hypothetical protein
VSHERGMAAIRRQMTDSIPELEMIDNDQLMREAGFDTSSADDMDNIWPKLSQKLGFDLACHQYEMPMKGRYTRLGHAEWNEPWHYDNLTGCPFETAEEVLSFDPVSECGVEPIEKIIATFAAVLKEARRVAPDVVVPGGRYHTLFSACIRTFGWEMFLSSVPHNEERFDRVLEGFTQISIAESEAWARAGAEVLQAHDDIAWTAGLVFSPEWYRRFIVPRYKRIWQPLKDRGIPVIFISDGNFSPLVDDIAAAGADGFMFEPTVSLDMMVGKFGADKVLIGNADCRILQFGSSEDVRREVRRCVDLGRRCPGFFMTVSNHIPNGIPPDNIRCYFDAFDEMRKR